MQGGFMGIKTTSQNRFKRTETAQKSIFLQKGYKDTFEKIMA